MASRSRDLDSIERSDALKKQRQQCEAPTSLTSPLPPARRVNPLDLRAFGLEDRADAVMSSSTSSWSLGQLAQWREQMLRVPGTDGDGASAKRQTNQFLRHRQREYRQQMLRVASTETEQMESHAQ
ncbi:hypothetical protein PINS_up004395 [Pythium insidiosum]|nr:hypothetical protein PINS_up004395 [Pythium insidiosum]